MILTVIYLLKFGFLNYVRDSSANIHLIDKIYSTHWCSILLPFEYNATISK